MRLLVNALGAWVAVRAAEGQYSRPVAIGLAMLVSRMGPGAVALTLAGYGLKRLDEAGAFDEFKPSRRLPQRSSRLASNRDADPSEPEEAEPRRGRDTAPQG
jgi:hypothetical protein